VQPAYRKYWGAARREKWQSNEAEHLENTWPGSTCAGMRCAVK
jgi:hypothetical protein